MFLETVGRKLQKLNGYDRGHELKMLIETEIMDWPEEFPSL